MFALLRLLFVLIVVAIAFTYWKQQRGDRIYWQKIRRWILWFAVGLAGLMLIGLFIQRLFVIPN